MRMILTHEGDPCFAQSSVQMPGYHWQAQGAAFQTTEIFSDLKTKYLFLFHILG